LYPARRRARALRARMAPGELLRPRGVRWSIIRPHPERLIRAASAKRRPQPFVSFAKAHRSVDDGLSKRSAMRPDVSRGDDERQWADRDRKLPHPRPVRSGWRRPSSSDLWLMNPQQVHADPIAARIIDLYFPVVRFDASDPAHAISRQMPWRMTHSPSCSTRMIESRWPCALMLLTRPANSSSVIGGHTVSATG
jgi:hypothetical protein